MLPITENRVLRFYAKELNIKEQGLQASSEQFANDAEFETAFRKRFWRLPDHPKSKKVLERCVRRGWINSGFNVTTNNEYPIVLRVAGVEHWRVIQRSMITRFADWIERRRTLATILIGIFVGTATIIRFWPLD